MPNTKTPKIAAVIACTGAAHSNCHIDYCMVCLGHSWGKIFSCSICSSGLKISRKTGKGKCQNGHGFFTIEK